MGGIYIPDRLVKILLLADLHFNHDLTYANNSALYNRHNRIVSNLISTLTDLPDIWKPQIVTISGDIGWYGVREDYDLAQNWCVDLVRELSIDPKHIILCPGNHDVDRNLAMNMWYPPTQQLSELGLSIEKIYNLVIPFRAFMDFQEHYIGEPFTIGRPELTLHDERHTSFYRNYIIGIKEFLGVRFVSLNSSWFSRDSDYEEQKHKLWIGINQLYTLNPPDNEIFKQTPESRDPITVVLLHHPDEYFNMNDESFDYLKNRSDIILTGHKHTTRTRILSTNNQAHIFKLGTIYNNPAYKNIFGIIKLDIENRSYDFREYRWEPRSERWRKVREESQKLRLPIQDYEYSRFTEERAINK